jgi:peptidyl-dipeptidase A
VKVLFNGSIPTLVAPQASKTDSINLLPRKDAFELRFSGQISQNSTELRAQQFIDKHSKAIQQLNLVAGEAGWASTCQGGDYVEPGQDKTNQQREAGAEQACKEYFNNPAALAEVEDLLKDKAKLTDRLLVRQVESLWKEFKDAGKSPELLAQEKAMMDRTSELTSVYNAYRGVADGQKISKLEINQRLQQTNNPVDTKKLWLAANGHGLAPVASSNSNLAEALQNLAKQRNAIARQNKNKDDQFYTDYFSMKLAEVDIREDVLVQLLDQVDEATREPFKQYSRKTEALSEKRYGISAEEAKLPWYGAGNLKRLLDFDLQPYLQGKDPLVLMQKTAQLMGDDLQKVFEKSTYVKNGETRSSIYFYPGKDDGKSQHWFSFWLNAPDDVRTFGSVDPQHQNMMDYAMSALLHEGIGHGLDGIHLDPNLPYLLRGHHSVTTECHAMLIENLTQDSDWLEKVVGIPKNEAQTLAKKAKLYGQAAALGQMRSMLATIQFERQMYKNPDQDLNKLWWDLQEKYLNVKRPPDGDLPAYACVPHYFSHPAYYQNYFLANLARAQKLEYINKQFGGLLNQQTGEYLRTYRSVGNKFDWDDLIERMTGKPLSADAFKAEFANFQLPA